MRSTRPVEKAAIAGVSYGGLIAAEYAARHPQRVTDSFWCPRCADMAARRAAEPLSASPLPDVAAVLRDGADSGCGRK